MLGAFTFAYGISNSGTIVGSYLGYGLYGPASFGFTASPAGGPEPAPEPISLFVFGAGLAGVAILRRRRKAKV